MGSPLSAVIANIYIEEFEEQGIAKATYKPKIWKWYICRWHFHSLRPGPCQQLFTTSKQSTAYYSFTMEIEKDNTIPFHETTVTRDSDSLLTTTVYRKPNHTNQYLAYDSHHLQSVKCGIVKCLYQWAKHLTMKLSVTSKEKKHLSSILVSDGYPSSFIWKLAKTTRVTAVLHYIEGVFEVLCCCLQHQGIWTIFKSDTTLRSHLVWTIKTRRCHLQDPMWMWQSVYQQNNEINV